MKNQIILINFPSKTFKKYDSPILICPHSLTDRMRPCGEHSLRRDISNSLRAGLQIGCDRGSIPRGGVEYKC